MNQLDFMRDFYGKLEESINKVDPTASASAEGKICPKCGKPLAIRKGKYGLFFGCTGYPKCNYMESIRKK